MLIEDDSIELIPESGRAECMRKIMAQATIRMMSKYTIRVLGLSIVGSLMKKVGY